MLRGDDEDQLHFRIEKSQYSESMVGSRDQSMESQYNPRKGADSE
jgi:hypothetical protein